MKFHIDANGLGAVASALSNAITGQGKMAGAMDALKLQGMQQQLEQRQFEMDEKRRMQQEKANRTTNIGRALTGLNEQDYGHFDSWRKGDLPYLADNISENLQARGILDGLNINPNSEFSRQIQAAELMNAYGGDGLDAAKAYGQIVKNQYDSAVNSNVANALLSGNQAAINSAVAAKSGNSYTPYRTDSNGMLLDTGTGQYMATPMYDAKLANVAASTQNQQADAYQRTMHGNLYGAQTQSEGIKQIGYGLDNENKHITGQINQQKLNDMLNPKLQAPDANVARLFNQTITDGNGNLRVVSNPEYMNKVLVFAQKQGINDILKAKNEYDAMMNMTRAESDRIIEDAAMLAQPRVSNMPNRFTQTYTQPPVPVPNNKAEAEMLSLSIKYGGRVSGGKKASLKKDLESLIHSGKITKDDAGNIWDVLATD